MQPPQVPQYLRAPVLAGHFPPSPEGAVCEKGQQRHVAEPRQLNQHRVLKPTVSPDAHGFWSGVTASTHGPSSHPQEDHEKRGQVLFLTPNVQHLCTPRSVTRRSHRGPGILIQPGALPGQDPLDAKNRNKTNHTVKDNVNGKICAVTPGSSPGPGAHENPPLLDSKYRHGTIFHFRDKACPGPETQPAVA